MTMKRIYVVLILLFQVSLLSLKAEEIDSLLLREYQSCHISLMNIIDEENLSDSLQGCSYYAYMFGFYWAIVVEKRHETVIYYRSSDLTRYKSYHFNKIIEKLNRIYSILDLDMSDNKRWDDRVYGPLCSYFAIFDKNNEVVFEWSSSTKSMRHERKIRKKIRKNLSYLYMNTDIFVF